MITSAITSKGQTTLPKPVREALGVGAGDRVCYVILGNAVRFCLCGLSGGCSAH